MTNLTAAPIAFDFHAAACEAHDLSRSAADDARDAADRADHGGSVDAVKSLADRVERAERRIVRLDEKATAFARTTAVDATDAGWLDEMRRTIATVRRCAIVARAASLRAAEFAAA